VDVADSRRASKSSERFLSKQSLVRAKTYLCNLSGFLGLSNLGAQRCSDHQYIATPTHVDSRFVLQLLDPFLKLCSLFIPCTIGLNIDVVVPVNKLLQPGPLGLNRSEI
jgi:hypothetical protein